MPVQRSGHVAVVYQGCMYVFGGWIGGSQHGNDLHEFNFQERVWSKIECSPAPPMCGRAGHSAVIMGNSMFVFGGFDGNIRLNDLHAFCYETRTWSEIRAGGHAPSPRAYHSAVTYEGSMYIFGGFDGNHRYNELYRYHFGTLRVARSFAKASCVWLRFFNNTKRTGLLCRYINLV